VINSKENEPKVTPKRRAASQWAVAWRRFRRNKAGVVGLIIVVAVVFVGIFGDFIAPYPAFPDPKALTPFYQGDVRTAPNAKYLLGTDVLGTDVLSDILHGTKYALYVGIVVTTITMAIAIVVGAVAGYFGSWIDNVLMRITEVFLVFPSLLFILIFVRVFTLGAAAGGAFNLLGISIPFGLTIVVIVLAVFNWPGDARMIRGEFLRVRELEFIEAEKALGANNRRIIFRHILPNILSSIIVVASLTIAYAILLEAGVSFLGFGDPSTMTWGQILENNFSDMRIVWWAELYPGLAILATVFGFNLLGDGLSDALNPRLRD
jgi:ABC-type dipeptide/oligopeptide/nickel transport system permease subunit